MDNKSGYIKYLQSKGNIANSTIEAYVDNMLIASREFNYNLFNIRSVQEFNNI